MDPMDQHHSRSSTLQLVDELNEVRFFLEFGDEDLTWVVSNIVYFHPDPWGDDPT